MSKTEPLSNKHLEFVIARYLNGLNFEFHNYFQISSKIYCIMWPPFLMGGEMEEKPALQN
uniref:Uncharacterized protein n=1 Tax=Anguilla anguilla TaxID=7936 RepID=A0A0E9UFK6_ANGAN